ncbi:winged helix-turn-helix domain-containing protein [Ancylobacter lacus]|uniref:winged helix-turn-helix domain-containing protein n=1 Tax=Ancylobacter lacus TaxID=2579970 RepID=UPI001BCC753A|nr:LysR family transcriptional regulator [Ancylobacter lacus]MBS7537835.1 LysR family transcriptional regulator [Ancylobacter lacus]
MNTGQPKADRPPETTTDAPETEEPVARPRDGLFIRVYLGDGRFLGPGKIDLLEAIRAERSILSAARKMGMSYRRAWLLVEELDTMFAERVVETHPGRRGHGTELTAFGERIIALYRDIEARSAAATQESVEGLRSALAAEWPPAPSPARSGPGRRAG